MDKLDRRRFLSVTAATAATAVGCSAAPTAGDQGSKPPDAKAANPAKTSDVLTAEDVARRFLETAEVPRFLDGPVVWVNFFGLLALHRKADGTLTVLVPKSGEPGNPLEHETRIWFNSSAQGGMDSKPVTKEISFIKTAVNPEIVGMSGKYLAGNPWDDVKTIRSHSDQFGSKAVLDLNEVAVTVPLSGGVVFAGHPYQGASFIFADTLLSRIEMPSSTAARFSMTDNFHWTASTSGASVDVNVGGVGNVTAWGRGANPRVIPVCVTSHMKIPQRVDEADGALRHFAHYAHLLGLHDAEKINIPMFVSGASGERSFKKTSFRSGEIPSCNGLRIFV